MLQNLNPLTLYEAPFKSTSDKLICSYQGVTFSVGYILCAVLYRT